MHTPVILRVFDQELYAAELADGGFKPKHLGDAGVDLRSTETVLVTPGKVHVIGLGVGIASMPVTYVGWLTGRSSTAVKFGLISHEGKIDSGYRGEMHAFLTALDKAVTVRRGDRICQLLVLGILPPAYVDPNGWYGWQTTTEPALENETDRGTDGLGSTGIE